MDAQLTRAEPTKKVRRKRTIFIWVLAILLALAVAASAYWFIAYRKATNSNPITRQQQAINDLSKHIEMPNEQPVVTTVLDKTKLSNKALADLAQNGDQLFIFTHAKRLVLYRPSDKKVVDMLTISN